MTASAPPERNVGGESGFVLTAAAIAEAVGGELIGDPSAEVAGIAPLDRASDTDLSFLATSRYAKLFETTQACVVLVSPELATTAGTVRARIIVDRPHEAMLGLLPRLYRPPEQEPGVSPTAVLGRGATLGSAVRIGPYVVIGDGARIGDRVTLDSHVTVGPGVTIDADSHVFPNATLYAGTRVGRRVTIHAGVRLGSDGFGYVFRDAQHEKLQHVGRCIIHDDVEIGANTTVDRGSIDDTVVGAGTKIDNLVQIGHNVRIGRLCLIMAQVGISGSARIEDGCIIAGQAGIGGHQTIGRGARIGGQAGVLGSVPAGESWSGYPARPHQESLRAHAAVFKLLKLIRRIERFLDRDDQEVADRTT